MKIVLTGGTFNKIHPGHIYLLNKAKKLGRLIVILAHDTHNRKDITLSAEERKKNMEKLEIADIVVIGDEHRFAGVLDKYKPDIIVLGYDQDMPDEETKGIVKERKIRVIRMERFGNY